MKKLVYSVILYAILARNQSMAQLPNPGFEQWDSSVVINGNKIHDPSDWFSSNAGLVDIGMEQTCVRTTDAHSGNYAIQLTSKMDDGDEQATYLTSGSSIGQGPSDPTVAKFRLQGRINGFEGYYKYMPNGVDSFRVFLAMYRNGQYLGQSFIYISASASSYTKFSWPVNYPGTITPPDSAKFIIEPSVVDGSEGSVLILDDLGVTYGFSSGVNEEDMATQFELYPNPTASVLTITSNTVIGDLSYKIVDAKGALVLKGQYNGVSIDVADLPQGLYNLLVLTPEGNTSSKTWIKK
ncbi:MAG: T9SS type A sorting domain-containing protein [Bacteroidia bacterium]